MFAVQFFNCTLKYDQFLIIDQLSLEFYAHRWTGILGPSGIGKSTLLQMIAGLIQPTKGNVQVHDKVTYLPQDLMLLPWCTVLSNVMIGYKIRGHYPDSKKQQAKEWLIKLGIEESFHHYYPHQLSGGMQKRVALCRILMEDCPLILLDEPMSSLDIPRKAQLYPLLRHLFHQKTVIIITHDPTDVLELCHDVLVMGYEKIQGTIKTTYEFKHIDKNPGLRSKSMMLEYSTYLLQQMTKIHVD